MSKTGVKIIKNEIRCIIPTSYFIFNDFYTCSYSTQIGTNPLVKRPHMALSHIVHVNVFSGSTYNIALCHYYAVAHVSLLYSNSCGLAGECRTHMLEVPGSELNFSCLPFRTFFTSLSR